MRDIKFRAWDENRKKMLIGDGQKEIALVGWSGDIFPMYYSSDMDGDIVNNIDMNDYLFHRDIKLMQFTGLLDKNGIEIYEGDIVEIRGHKITTDFICKIIFEDGSFGRKTEFSFIPLCQWTLLNDCGVIGNVYEHPHLLEATK